MRQVMMRCASSFLAVICTMLTVNAQETPMYPFAMCSNGNMLTNPKYPEQMLDTGARMVRLDASFATVRAKEGDDPNAWDWTVWQRMRDLRQKHPDLQILPILGYGTLWAEDAKFAEVKGGKCSPPPRGIEIMPASDPRNLYGNYVYETVKRYKDVTKYWESWNEPDLPGNHYFKGDGKDFFAYQKAFYLAAKAADPDCVVTFAAMCYPTVEGYMATHGLKPPTISPPANSFFEQYLAECVKDPDAKKNNYYFDIMNQHTYSRASDLYNYTAILQKLMGDYLKEQKPIWITEMGFTEGGPPFGGTSEEYADYILQSYAWGAMAGVQRFFHFQLDNSNGHGLYKGNGEPKLALFAYRDVLAKEFADAKFVAQLHGTKGFGALEGNSAFDRSKKAGYNLFEFQSHDGKRRMLMAFTDTDKAVTIKVPAKASQAILIDRLNKRSTITAKDGAYEIELAGATNLGGWPSIKDNEKAKALGQPEHLVGGATLVIVEGAKQ